MATEPIDTPISVVVPCYNEESVIKEVLSEIHSALKKSFSSWEIIVVDDGSTDETGLLLGEIARSLSGITIETLPGNRGQSIALFEGFKLARHEIVVAMDADGQNDPRDIHRLVTRLASGNADCVSGWRHERKDAFLRVLYSQAANRLIANVSGLRIHDFGCTLKAYRKDALSRLLVTPDIHRVIPAYIAANGGVIHEETVSHRPRLGGSSKYGYGRVIAVLQDLVMIYATVRHRSSPLRLLGGLGLAFWAAALVSALVAVLLRIFGSLDFVESPLLLFSGILALMGTQLLTSGVVFQLMATRLDQVSYESAKSP